MDCFPGIDRNLPPPPHGPLMRQEGTTMPSFVYMKDIAGNNVPIDVNYIATIKSKLNMSAGDLETLIKQGRPPSPCPCQSAECLEVYNREKKDYETLQLECLEGTMKLKPRKDDYETLLSARAKGEHLPTLLNPSGWGHSVPKKSQA